MVRPPSKRTSRRSGSDLPSCFTRSSTRADGANREARNSSRLRFSPRGSRTSFTANGEHEQQTRVAQEPRSSILSLLQLSGNNSMFVIPQACEERQADSSNKKTMMPHRDGNRDAGARATLGFQTGANFVVQDAPVFLSAPAGHLRVFQELGRESRNRLQECYLNGSCLLQSISCGAFRKVPFFLRHLWHAVAE